MSVRDFFAELGVQLPAGPGANVSVRCFADPRAHRHEDREPSCSVSVESGAWRCFACGARGGAYDAAMALGRDPARAMEALRRHGLVDDDRGGTGANVRPPPGPAGSSATGRPRQGERPSSPAPSELDFDRYRAALDDRALQRLRELRGWAGDAVRALGVGLDRGRVLFPVRDATGALTGALRYAPDPARRNGTPKMLAAKGTPRELFPPPEQVKGDTVWLVEGEPDAVAGATLDLPTVAVPGAAKWQPEWAARLAEGRKRVVVIPDADEPGRGAAQRIAAAVAEHCPDVRVLDLDPERTDGYDVGDLVREAAEHGADGLAGARRLLDGMAAAAEPVAASAAPQRNGAATSPARVLTFTPASAIRPERTRWLWAERLPLGAVSLLAGRQGLGKSTLTTELAARATRGELDGDLHGQAVAVLLVSFEDSEASTIVPRLMAAGADLDLVRIVAVKRDDGPDLVSLPGDIAEIAAGAREHEARLLVVDPVVASLPADINAHRDQDVRRALAPLARLAEDCDLAVLGSIHFNKGAGADIIIRASGSIGFTAAARSVLAFGADPEDPDGERGSARVLAHAKCNVGPLAPSLACRVEGRVVDGPDGALIQTSRLVVTGEHSASASDLLATRSSEDRSAEGAAHAFLADHLADGAWHPRSEVKAAAEGDDLAWRTVQRASEKFGVEVGRRGFPAHTEWRLPVAPTPHDATGDDDPWRDCEKPAATGDSPGPACQSRQTHDIGATGALTATSTPSRPQGEAPAEANGHRPLSVDELAALALDDDALPEAEQAFLDAAQAAFPGSEWVNEHRKLREAVTRAEGFAEQPLVAEVRRARGELDGDLHGQPVAVLDVLFDLLEARDA